jgi:hypothetical protein
MLRIHGWILAIETVFMIPALAIAIFTEDIQAIYGFLGAMGVAIACAALMAFVSRNAKRKFYAREGLVCTGMAWIVLSLVGALPFYISGRIPRYVDAFFEIVSGFTTTGASVISDVEALGKAILYWRSFSHWVGGMGVLVFFLAIVPASGRNDGYMLHIIYNATASPSEKNHETVNDSPDAVTMSWDLDTTPVAFEKYPTHKPTATITINSTKCDATKLKTLEDTLYGTANAEPTLPSPDDVIDIFK